MKKIKRRKNKRGEGDFQWKKILELIFLAVVVICAVIVVYHFKLYDIDKINALLPNWMKSNYTAPEVITCPYGYTGIGSIDKNNYIYLHGLKTNLYISYNSVKFDTSWYAPSEVVGVISNGVFALTFPAYLDAYDYRKLLPSEDDRRLLDRASIYEGTICVSDDKMNRLTQEDKCILTCDIADGVCSNVPVSGKVSYKQLNCPAGQICYVDLTEDKLSSGNMTLTDTYMELPPLPGGLTKTVGNLLSQDNFQFKLSDMYQLQMSMDYNVPFCYVFDSDNPDINAAAGYIPLNIAHFAISSNQLTYSNDKFINFIAWNKDTNQKVIKRWKFVTQSGGRYVNVDKSIIRDGDFYFNITSAKIGDAFYVIGLIKTWEVKSGFIQTKDFKIVKDDISSISIYTWDDSAASWHQLYCNKGAWFSVFRSNSMKITDTSSSLSETLDKHCAWSS